MTAKKSSKKKGKKGRKTKTQEPPIWTSKWVLSVALFAFAILLYSSTFKHSYVLDDDLVVVKNEFVQNGISGLDEIFTSSWYEGFTAEKGRYYRPLMLASFAIEKSLFGSSASTHHTLNVIYYGLAVVFLFIVLLSMFPGYSRFFPFLVSILFIVHPIHTEVVSNIKSRDEILAFIGLLGIIYSLLKYIKINQVKWLVLGLVSYFLAILSKEAALAFLGIVPLTLYYFTKANAKKIFFLTFTFGIVAAIYFLVRSQIVTSTPGDFSIIDNSLLAIQDGPTRLATKISMLGKYLSLLIFPHPLSYDYSFNQIPATGWNNWKVWSSLLICLGLIFIAIKGLRTKSPISFGILFFGITFSITSNLFFLTGATFAERFMFTPSLAFCLILGWLIWNALNQTKSGKVIGHPLIIKGSLAVLILLFMVKTLTRSAVWKDDSTLFASGVITAPNSARSQSFYGNKFYKESQSVQNNAIKNQLLDSSIHYYQRSLNILPSFTETYQHLALAYEDKNQLNNAIQTYRAAIAQDPNYFPARTNLGILLYELNEYTQSIKELEPAAALAPNNSTVQRALGKAYEGSGAFQKAAEQYNKALSIRKNAMHLGDLVKLYRDKLMDTTSAISYDRQIKELSGN